MTMNAVFRVVTRIQDQDDFSGNLTDGQFLKYNSSTNNFELQSVSPGGDSGQLQYNNSGSFAGVNHSSIGISGDIFKLNSLAIGDIPFVVKGCSGQTANLTEWRDSAGTVGARVTTAREFSNPTSQNAGGEAFGAGSILSSHGLQVAIGKSVTASGQQSIAIGYGAYTDNYHAIGIGSFSYISGNQAMGIGWSTRAYGADQISIGEAASGTGARTVTLGNFGVANFADSVLLGYGVTATAANQFIAGSSTTAINNVYFGKGVTHATPTAYTINGTGGSGTNIAGANLNLAGGKGTGTGAGGSLVFQVSPAGSTGSTANALVDALTIDSTLNAAFSGTITSGGAGVVLGPASSTDNAIVTFDGTTGKMVKNNSGVTISGNVVRMGAGATVDYLGVGPVYSSTTMHLWSRGGNVTIGTGPSSGERIWAFTTTGGNSYTDTIQGTFHTHRVGGTDVAVFSKTGSNLKLTASGSTIIPLTVKAAASQTANLTEWQNSSGTVLTSISSAGYVSIPDGDWAGGAPGLRFASDTNTGLVRIGADSLQLMAGTPYGGLFVEAAAAKFGWNASTLSTGNGAGQLTFTAGGYSDTIRVLGGIKLSPNINYGYSTQEAVLDCNPTGFINYSAAATYSWFATSRFGVMNMTASTGQAIVLTNNATVRIDGAPTASGGVTQTNAWALHVVAGDSKFGGQLSVPLHNGTSPAGISIRGDFGGDYPHGISFDNSYLCTSFWYGGGRYATFDANWKLTSGKQFIWVNSASDSQTGTSDTGLGRSAAGIVQITNGSTGLGSLIVGCYTAATIGLTVKAAASQSANLTEWQNSSGTVGLSVDSSFTIRSEKTSGAKAFLTHKSAGTINCEFGTTNGYDVYLKPAGNPLYLGNAGGGGYSHETYIYGGQTYLTHPLYCNAINIIAGSRYGVYTKSEFEIAAHTHILFTGTGTVAYTASAVIRQPTVSIQTGSGTVTDAASLRIEAAPDAGTGMTLTNAWALHVVAGNSKFGGDITCDGIITSGGLGAVLGPASATDNEVVRFDTATGKIVQAGSGVTISDTGYVTARRVGAYNSTDPSFKLHVNDGTSPWGAVAVIGSAANSFGLVVDATPSSNWHGIIVRGYASVPSASQSLFQAVVGATNVFICNANGSSVFTAAVPTAVVATFKAAASQSANLTEWQNSSGTVLSSFNASGFLTMPGTTFSDGGQGAGAGFKITSGSHASIAVPAGYAMYSVGKWYFEPNYNHASYGVVINNNANATPLVTPLQIVANSSQTGNLTEWQNSSGTVKSFVTATGQLGLGYTASSITAGIDLRVNGYAEFDTAITGNISTGNLTLYGSYNSATGISLGLNGQTVITLSNAAVVGLSVKAAASQSANLTEWQNSSGDPMLSIGESGQIYLRRNSSSDNSYAGILFDQSQTNLRIYSKSGVVVFGSGINSGSRFLYCSASGSTTTLDTINYSNFVLKAASSTVLTLSTTTTNALIAATGAAIIPFTVKAAASQTANLTEWQNSSGTVKASISAGGERITFGGSCHLRTGSGYEVVVGTASGEGVMLSYDGITLRSTANEIAWGSSNFSTANTMTLLNPSSNVLQIGRNSATPVGNTLQGPGGSGTNIAGANINIAGGKGTGTGVGGSVVIQVAPAGSTGSSANALVDALTIDSTNVVTVGRVGIGTQAVVIEGYYANAQKTQLNENYLKLFYSGTGGKLEIYGSYGNSSSYIKSSHARITIANTVDISLSGGCKLNVNNYGKTADVGTLNVWAYNSSTVGMIITGAASQSANLTEWQNSSGTVGACITAAREFSNTFGVAGTEAFGASATAAAASAAFGPAAVAMGSNSVAVGYDTISRANSISIGRGVRNNASGDGVGIGYNAVAGYHGITIGQGAGGSISITSGIAIGSFATPVGDGGIAIGFSAAAATNTFVAGSASASITNVFFGEGITDGTPLAYTINGTGGSGTNIAGANLNIAGGKGTGTGAGGSVVIQVAPAGSSGSTANALVDAITIDSTGSITTIGTATIGAYTLPATDGTVDQVLTTNGAGSVSWGTISGGGGGIASINGNTSSAQLLTVGSAGTDFAIDSTTTAGTSVFNIPDASATARGLVTTGTQTFAGQKTVQATSAAHVPLVLKGATSQSARHLSFQTSGGSEYLSIDVTTATPAIIANSSFSIEAAMRGYGWAFQDVGAVNYAGFWNVYGYNQFSLASTTLLTWSSGTNARNAGDLHLVRDGADTLAQRRGTNAQCNRIYTTWASTTNYERLNFKGKASANFEIGPENGSAGGTLRGLTIGGYSAGSSTITPWLTFTNAGVATFSSTLTVQASSWIKSSDGAERLYFTDSSGLGITYVKGNGVTFRNLSNATIGSISSAGVATFAGQVTQTPPPSVTLSTNGQFSVEMTSDTEGNLVYRGSDGTTRRSAIVFV